MPSWSTTPQRHPNPLRSHIPILQRIGAIGSGPGSVPDRIARHTDWTSHANRTAPKNVVVTKRLVTNRISLQHINCRASVLVLWMFFHRQKYLSRYRMLRRIRKLHPQRRFQRYLLGLPLVLAYAGQIFVEVPIQRRPLLHRMPLAYIANAVPRLL